MTDLNGKIVVMTGATSGMGKVVATRLAQRGATLGILARDLAKAERLRADIGTATSDRVKIFPADLASLEDIARAADVIRQQFERIDVLINNAGVLKLKQEFSRDGFELSIAINHLAVHALTLRLLDRLLEAERPRIVNVSSESHRAALLGGEVKVAIDTWRGDPNYRGFLAYSRSKLTNLHFTYALAAKLGSWATVNAVHPGMVRTEIGREFPIWLAFPFRLLSLTPERGAEPIVRLALDPTLAGVTGEYFNRMRKEKSSPQSYDQTVRGEVWKASVAATGLGGAWRDAAEPEPSSSGMAAHPSC